MHSRFSQSFRLGAGALALVACGLAHAAGGSSFSAVGSNSLSTGSQQAQSSLVINLAGTPSDGEWGDPSNTVMSFNIGANAMVTSVSWNFTITAYEPSWLSEMTIDFTDSAQADGVSFAPSSTDDPGTESFSGTADLNELGLAFSVGADGILRVEFYEAYQDAVSPNGTWDSGTLTIDYVTAVPEPASYGLMALGLAGLGLVARRRRSLHQ